MKRKIEVEIYNVPPGERGATDYHYTMTKGTTKESREKMNTGDIWINGAVCLLCKDFIRSKNLHHYTTCSCGNISVDGGSWYAKRVSKSDNFINVIEEFGKSTNNNEKTK